MGILTPRVQLLLGQEKAHVTNRGMNYIAAVTFNIVALYFTLKILNNYWPEYILARQESIWEIYFFVYMGVVFAVHAVNHIMYSLMDRVNWFDQYKITRTNLPWKVNPQGWRRFRNKAILVNLLNIGIVTPMMFYLDSVYTKVSFSPEIPSYFTVVSQLFVCMAIEATSFYIFHRIAHQCFYKFHKMHHEFIVPTALATNYNHPIDYLTDVLLPFTLGPKLFGARMHFLTFMIWTVWRMCGGYEGHSNYQFPWSPMRINPFSATSEYHSFHHTSNVGNYGSTMFIQDTLSATNTEYFKRPNSTCFEPTTPKTD